MRVATYHRVSTLDQRPELARDELQAAAGRLGSVVEEIEETGSGARNDRPGLQRLMAAARAGKLDCVVVWKLDRFGRSALDLLANVRELTSRGVRFMATTQGLDIRPGGDAMGGLILTVLAAVAEFERELIRERTRAGLAESREQGRVGGRKPVIPGVAVVRAAELRAEVIGPYYYRHHRSWAEVAAGLKREGLGDFKRTTVAMAVTRFRQQTEPEPVTDAGECHETG